MKIIEKPQSWPPIPQGNSQSKAIEREQIKLEPLNFQDYFLQICTFKRYGTDCGCGSTLLHTTPTFRNRSKTYGAPCRCKQILNWRTTKKVRLVSRSIYIILITYSMLQFHPHILDSKPQSLKAPKLYHYKCHFLELSI